MNCKWCNKEVENNAKFCPNCGGNLVSFENQVNEQVTTAYTQPTQQPETNVYTQSQNTTINSQEGKVNVGLVILSCLIPLAGLIIFLIKKDEDKKTAKASGIAALISFCFCLLVSVVLIVTSFVRNSITSFGNGIHDYVEDNISDIIVPDYYPEEENNNDDDIENLTTSSEWQKYEFSVNGYTLKLPCTYSELSSATSSEMQSSYTKSYLQAGYYALVNMYKNDSLSLYIEVLNDTDADILYTDGKITRVSQTDYHVSVGADAVIFPGGLKVGQAITKDEIVNLFGEPFEVDNYSSDGYTSDLYSYVEDTYYTTTNYYEIKVVNGIIDELTLDNRDYN